MGLFMLHLPLRVAALEGLLRATASPSNGVAGPAPSKQGGKQPTAHA
jgi:hypothetical protein